MTTGNENLTRAEKAVKQALAEQHGIHLCDQCGLDMGNEWILGPVCGKCCRANHRRALGLK